ncbi:MAG: hypothetical protein AB7V18_14400 [Pyrinomonadaceae bacterium]
MGIVNLPADCDGKHILLNVPHELEPNAKLAARAIQVDEENGDELTHFPWPILIRTDITATEPT